MHARDAQRYVEYVLWVRDRILSAAAGLSAADLTADPPAGMRDLRGTLLHELTSEWGWRIRMTTGSFPSEGPTPESFPTLTSLASRWADEEQELQAWVASLSDEDLRARPPGGDNVLPRSDYVMQVVAHAVQQSSDAAVLLSQLGRSPGNIDYIAFCNERG